MPYYQREDALRITLDSYCRLYGDDIELIIVDDGSPDRLEIDAPWVKVINLPQKAVGYAPVIPYNIGVEYASHDLICLTLPEVSHETPAIYAMRDAWEPNAYVMAQCWCDSMGRWLAREDFEPGEGQQQCKPKGVAFNFCTMLDRELWRKVGGMGREYRWGSHFDDTDFAKKIEQSGACLKWVGDVVEHTRVGGARAPWVKGGWVKNKNIFEAKWTAT